MKLNRILLRKGYATIKLKKINTNHFELKATLNGVKGRFILDTGASNSCIDFSLSEKFKLKVTDSDTKAAGAGAIGMETKIAKKNAIQLKDWKFKNLNLTEKILIISAIVLITGIIFKWTLFKDGFVKAWARFGYVKTESTK